MSDEKQELPQSAVKPIFVKASEAAPVRTAPQRFSDSARLFAIPEKPATTPVVWKRLEGASQPETAADVIANAPAPETPSL